MTRSLFTPFLALCLERPLGFLRRSSVNIAVAIIAISAASAFAGSREQALQIHNRVAGVPPSEAVLLQMTGFIEANQTAEAVKLAMNNDAFYSVVLKNLATPWTNR